MSPFKFGKRSQRRLEECHPVLQQIMYEALAVSPVDFTILCGHRTKAEQDDCCERGVSRVRWPNSLHNQQPSLAVDVAPFPINWRDRERFCYLAGIIKGVAAMRGVDLRWGGDWDDDGDLHDQRLSDLPHFELKSWRE